MTLKKESLLNYLAIHLIITTTRLLNFFDFKVRSIFIFFNIIISSFFLMVYVKPYLDEKLILQNNNNQKIAVVSETSPQVTVTLPPETIPFKTLTFNEGATIAARSFIIYDLKNNQEIFQKNKLDTLPPASLVKMLSVMYFSTKINLNTKYEVYPECSLVDGQKVGFKKGEKISGKDLMYSSLVFSAGDSICNMYKISESRIDEFNKYAKELGMKNSNFTNFIGLDYPGNITTSEDLLTMTKEFINNPLFNDIVALKSYKLENGKLVYNTNKMLFENSYSVGIKTGTTFGAKENLIYRYKNDDNDVDILVILLNSPSRYQDVRNILKSLN